MLLCQKLKSPFFIWFNTGDFQNNSCQFQNFLIGRTSKRLKSCDIFFGDICLFQVVENFFSLLNFFDLFFWLTTTRFANMISMTFS